MNKRLLSVLIILVGLFTLTACNLFAPSGELATTNTPTFTPTATATSVVREPAGGEGEGVTYTSTRTRWVSGFDRAASTRVDDRCPDYRQRTTVAGNLVRVVQEGNVLVCEYREIQRATTTPYPTATIPPTATAMPSITPQPTVTNVPPTAIAMPIATENPVPDGCEPEGEGYRCNVGDGERTSWILSTNVDQYGIVGGFRVNGQQSMNIVFGPNHSATYRVSGPSFAFVGTAEAVRNEYCATRERNTGDTFIGAPSNWTCPDLVQTAVPVTVVPFGSVPSGTGACVDTAEVVRIINQYKRSNPQRMYTELRSLFDNNDAAIVTNSGDLSGSEVQTLILLDVGVSVDRQPLVALDETLNSGALYLFTASSTAHNLPAYTAVNLCARLNPAEQFTWWGR